MANDSNGRSTAEIKCRPRNQISHQVFISGTHSPTQISSQPYSAQLGNNQSFAIQFRLGESFVVLQAIITLYSLLPSKAELLHLQPHKSEAAIFLPESLNLFQLQANMTRLYMSVQVSAARILPSINSIPMHSRFIFVFHGRIQLWADQKNLQQSAYRSNNSYRCYCSPELLLKSPYSKKCCAPCCPSFSRRDRGCQYNERHTQFHGNHVASCSLAYC